MDTRYSASSLNYRIRNSSKNVILASSVIGHLTSDQ